MSTFPEKLKAPDGRRPGKAPEKPNFTQTCSLLSQFLKEKRSSGAVSLGMAGNAGKIESKATTMNLLTNLENTDDALGQNGSALDFLPQFVENACIKQSDLRSSAVTDSATPQLSIFYSGKVLVFDAFPPEKATEIMELATKLSSDSASSRTNKNTPVASVATEDLNQIKVPQTNPTQEAPRPGSQALNSDMRYPRRASLLKFLEKRKERVNARAPYQLNNNPKHEGGSSGDDPEDQSCKHLDLNL